MLGAENVMTLSFELKPKRYGGLLSLVRLSPLALVVWGGSLLLWGARFVLPQVM